MTSTAIKFSPNRVVHDVLLVILDLDRTLFDTGNYFADFIEWVEFNLGPNLCREFINAEMAGEFDVFKYLKQLGYKPDQVKTSFTRFIQQKYGTRHHSYLMPGARQLLEFLRKNPRAVPFILTTGSQEHQKFKIELTKELHGLLYHITPDNKGVMIQQDLDDYGGCFELNGKFYEDIALVDDKSSSLLPVKPKAAHVTMLFHVATPGSRYCTPAGRKDIQEVSCLAEVNSALGAYLRPQLR